MRERCESRSEAAHEALKNHTVGPEDIDQSTSQHTVVLEPMTELPSVLLVPVPTNTVVPPPVQRDALDELG